MPVAGPDKDSKSADSRPARVASPEQVFAHLETVLASPVFRTSKRCQKLLRFVVENTALGRVDLLKERTIGIEVFSRPPHYEPSEDAIVRVNANEVRKRLAQYYLSAGRQGVWFELPAGSYVPEFHFGPPAETEAAPEPLEPPPPARRVFFERRLRTWLAAAGVLAAAGTFGAVLFFQAEAPLEEFWAPMWAADIPPLVSLPIGSATLISPRLQGELTRQSPPFSKPVLAGPGEIEILPEQAVAALGDHHRVEHDVARAPAPQALGDGADQLGGIEHADLDRIGPDVLEHGVDLGRGEGGGHGVDGAHPGRVLRREGGDRRGAVAA